MLMTPRIRPVHERHGVAGHGVGSAGNVEWIDAGVGAVVGLALGGDPAGDAVVDRLRPQLHHRHFGPHPFADERLELVGPGIKRRMSTLSWPSTCLATRRILAFEEIDSRLAVEAGEHVGVEAASSPPAWCRASSRRLARASELARGVEADIRHREATPEDIVGIGLCDSTVKRR